MIEECVCTYGPILRTIECTESSADVSLEGVIMLRTLFDVHVFVIGIHGTERKKSFARENKNDVGAHSAASEKAIKRYSKTAGITHSAGPIFYSHSSTF